ncbi:SGNH/GDSL hydrolase family protein [Intrasporangium sp.]|uniref:SGNH/GDSL hydrolase family protein n=1 Tax=Intrasporangium sp. TaxID=1925024 RepID=UPI0032214D4F
MADHPTSGVRRAGVIGALVLVGAVLLGLAAARLVAFGPLGAAHPSAAGTGAPSRSDPLRIVALGDSVPADTGCPCRGYVADLGAVLQGLTHRTTDVRNDAVAGWTSADVLTALDSGQLSGDLAGADLVVVQAGANDFDPGRIGDPACPPTATSPCWRPTLATLRTGLVGISRRVRALDTNPDLRIALVGYWNVTVDGAVGQSRGAQFVTDSTALTVVVNDTISAVAAQQHDVYVDAFTGFKGPDGRRDPTPDLQADGDHPNAAGNAILTAAVRYALVDSGALPVWTAP